MKIIHTSIIYKYKWSSKVKTEFLSLKSQNWQVQLEWSRPLLEWSRPFAALFEWVPVVQIKCKMAHWKALSVYFPSQVEFLDLELIWPLKSQFSQGHFLQLKKWAESQNFDVFWAFGGPNLKIKFLPSIGNFSFCMPFPKMSTFCDSEQSSRVVSRGVRPLHKQKPVNFPKISKMLQNFQNF